MNDNIIGLITNNYLELRRVRRLPNGRILSLSMISPQEWEEIKTKRLVPTVKIYKRNTNKHKRGDTITTGYQFVDGLVFSKDFGVITLDKIKKLVLQANNDIRDYISDKPRPDATTYIDLLMKFNLLGELKEPAPDTLGGQIWHDFTRGDKMKFRISEKQAFIVALEFCRVNGIDKKVIQKYTKKD